MKVRTRLALLEQLDSLSEHTNRPDIHDDPADLAQATVAVVETLNKLEMSSQMEEMLKKLNDMGLGL